MKTLKQLADDIRQIKADFEAKPDEHLDYAGFKKGENRFLRRIGPAEVALTRYQPRTPAELVEKVRSILEVVDIDDAFTISAALKAWRNSMLRDLEAVLFQSAPTQGRIFELIEERRELAAECRSILDEPLPESGLGAAPGSEHLWADHDRRIDDALDRKFKNESQIARCKVRNYAAAVALSQIIAMGNENEDLEGQMAIVNEENYARITKSLAAFLASGAPRSEQSRKAPKKVRAAKPTIKAVDIRKAA